ncbi:hypothetical protein NHG32_03500 [Aerococcaceae bacterium NML191219]|nr:hypothetical protein [Aerococcaceae bacterium NML191219]
MMHHKFRSRLLSMLSIALLSTPLSFAPLNHSLVIHAESSAPFMLKGQEIDTLASIYPQIEFEIVEADNVLDSIVIKPETLLSSLPARAENVTTIPKFTSDFVHNQTYRDFSTFSLFYIKNGDRSVDIISPVVGLGKAEDFFTPLNFIEAQAQDIGFKLEASFLRHYTQNPYEMYAISKNMPISLIADAKGDWKRAKHFLSLIPENHPDYTRAAELTAQIEEDLRLIASRYTNATSPDPQTPVRLHPDSEGNENAHRTKELIERTLQTLPLDVRQRIAEIQVIPSDIITGIAGDSSIQGYAFTDHVIKFSDAYDMEPGLIYHEVGHIVDFSSYIYNDASLEEHIGFSNTPEWLAVHEKEWNIEGSYYGIPLESFAQAFAGYMLERVEGVQLSAYGYVDTDLADRPETRAYFDKLFEKLGLNQ